MHARFAPVQSVPFAYLKIGLADNEIEFDFVFSEQELDSALKKGKLDESNIKKIKETYNNIVKQKRLMNGFVKKCLACQSTFNLDPGTIIYSINLDKQVLTFNDINIDLKINDQTLPRTKDYICRLLLFRREAVTFGIRLGRSKH